LPYLLEKLNKTPYNTDNMGKLFVMVFAFAPGPKTNPAETCTRTRAPARNLNPAP
jgi:hypothetical protein